MSVTFTRYELTRAAQDDVGPQPWYFEPVEKIGSAHQYCDVNEAFAAELGLGKSH